MTTTYLIYTLSVSFQVAGALMLIVFAISTKRKSIIRSFASSNVIFEDGDTHKLEYNQEAFISEYRTAYYSKVSVIYIALGYGVGIFGNIGSANCWMVLLIVVCLSAALILTTRFIIEGLLRRDTVTTEITKEELEKVGCEATIGSMSSAEVDALFEEVEHEELDEAMERLEEINDKMKKRRDNR